MNEKNTDLNKILEIYKIYLQMADKISDRRQSANSFFLAINTVIVSSISYISISNTAYSSNLFYIFVSIAGMVICYYWYRLIRSYKDLNSGKFKVIHQIESYLPLSPYDTEWEMLGRGKDKKKYLPFTKIEMRIPWVFFALHFSVFVINIPWNNLVNCIQK